MLIDKLKKEQVQNIEINIDLYRFISAEQWGSFENNTVETGSLFDDIDNLKLLISEPDRPFTYVDFDRLASLLLAISETKNPAN